MKIKLKQIIETQNTVAGKTFDFFFQFLILLSLIMFSLETLPSLYIYKDIFNLIEVITVVLFTGEYLLRFFVAESKMKFMFSFNGVVDLFAILPFYVSRGVVDLRFIRIFRLFRLFRAFKIFRYSKAVDRFVRAFVSVKSELVVFFMATLFVLFLASAGIYYFENEAQPEQFKSIFHSMWWAVATLTTVGFGDIYPVTVGGKIFTFVILMLGLGVVSVPSALLASALSREDIK